MLFLRLILETGDVFCLDPIHSEQAPSTPERQIIPILSSPPSIPSLPMKRSFGPVTEPHSEARPTKRLRPTTSPTAVQNKVVPPSMITKVKDPDKDQASSTTSTHKKSKPVPYINFLEIEPPKKRKSSEILHRQPVSAKRKAYAPMYVLGLNAPWYGPTNISTAMCLSNTLKMVFQFLASHFRWHTQPLSIFLPANTVLSRKDVLTSARHFV